MKVVVGVEGMERVRDTFARVAAAPQRALDATAVEVEQYIDTQVAPHNKTHALERSLGKRRIPGGWQIEHDSRIAPHAIFVHWGTKWHFIRPKNKKALRWAAGGAFAFAKRAKHPGYKGDRWMERAAAKAPMMFKRHIEALLA